MQAIVTNYEALYSAMEASLHGIDDCFRRASGVLAVMDRFSTFFGVILSILIFSIIEQLSVTLQGVTQPSMIAILLWKCVLKLLKGIVQMKNLRPFFMQ